MGGRGSGPRFRLGRKKTTVGQCLVLDANRWMREGTLKAGQYQRGRLLWPNTSGPGFVVNYEAETRGTEPHSVRLWYSWTWWGEGPLQSADYEVGLTTTSPRFGGLRWWFVCPLSCRGVPCGRRVAKLHLAPWAHYFGCRHCHDLTYASRQESRRAHPMDAYLTWKLARGPLPALLTRPSTGGGPRRRRRV
jgi:hypothetical protein